ncbi:ATP-binding protein [Streptomyces sp. NPDC005526]|uniref:sensor histidine kinase n=1 Tax=Streptomyces sp. NPDC005526 TaxID=3156885 RepID=UPI0033AB1634
MTAPTPPGERPALRALAPLPACTAVLSAVALATAVSAAPAAVRTPLAWGAGVAAVVLVAAVLLAVHARQTARIARRRLQAVTLDTERLAQERDRLVAESQRERQHLIDELGRQRAEFTEYHAQERARLEGESAHGLERLTRENADLAASLERATRARDTAIAATANAAGRMQALTTAILADLREMEERHADEDVLTDLLHLDHRTAQAGRLADSVAVLTGARSGRRWARPISMESILRGAMGRISAYRRVRVHASGDSAVAGHAAEGVMHALAELLDNAANFSPPTAEVHVYVEEVPSGVIVSVEDSGLVMGETQLRRAERAVSGDISGLGGLTGTRLGLAVVGRLARKYGLKVSFRPSARGGTGVLMLVPQEILTSAAAPHRPAGTRRAAGKPASADAPPATWESGATDAPLTAGQPTSADAPPATGKPGAADASPTAGNPGTADARPAAGTAERVAGPQAAAPADDAGPAPAHAGADSADLSASGGNGGSGADERPTSLPKRRRGRTLAEAERARAAARASEPRSAPAADDAKVRAARFSSFREAVRATPPDHAGARDRPDARHQADPSAAASAPADMPSHPYAHPEGDPTS